ncbi:response regulator transcription factor [Brevundimonas sp.]|uniref:response regulator transcription factor n=1 Tax=Brevundimonas sp. TaxID=1871086 RepID=UPI0025BCCBD0|nr:response regulator transcription factor [Brevundimonas sp.]
MRFLVVEDDPDLADAIQRHLQRDGHAADVAPDGDYAYDLLQYQAYELIILDIGLPGRDGFSVLKSLRGQGNRTPVLVLTARSAIEDKVGALDVGADDYLSKPFDFRELDARCRSLMRRNHGVASSESRIGGLTFDRSAKTVRLHGDLLPLPNREYRLLEIFLGNLGRVLSKERIASQLFDFSDEVGDNAVELYVGRLRRKLGDEHVRISTQRGFGYVAEANVHLAS